MEEAKKFEEIISSKREREDWFTGFKEEHKTIKITK